MGIRCSSELRRGQYIITMKIFLFTVFVAVALAEEVVEDAKPAAVVPIIANNYAHSTYSWPGVSGHGFSSQCWGCHPIGKRSAEAEPEAKRGLAYLPHPFGYYGFAPYVYALPTLSTLPELPALEGKDEGLGAHPNGATSWTQRSAQGAFVRRRRSAEPEAEADPGLFYHPYAYPVPAYHAVVPAHPVPAYPAVVPAYHAVVPVVPATKPIEVGVPAVHPDGTARIS